MGYPLPLSIGIFGLLAACTGSPTDEVPSGLSLTGAGFSVEVDAAAGTFDVLRADTSPVLTGAFAEVGVRDPETERETRYYTRDGYDCAFFRESGQDALGRYDQLRGECTGHAAGPDLVWRIATYAGEPFVAVTLEAHPTAEITLGRLVPAKVDADHGGALLIGSHPASHRILEAGASLAFDFFVDILPGDTAPTAEAIFGGLFTGFQAGHSVSNSSHAIKDLASGRAFVAGSLDFAYASPMLNISFVAEDAREVDGRTSFTYWAAELPYQPEGKPLAAEQSLRAGPILIFPAPDDVFAALETYADAVKTHNGIRLWPERGVENRVPTGWNSWTGSGSSGGYGTNIDEALMLDNLDAMATELRDFGGEWFQIDDGYEYAYGDWDWRTDRFPNGSAGLASEITAAGMLPGVWIAPFQVDAGSQTYADHEADGWFPERIPMLAGDKPILDLTHPDVLAWVTDRFRRIRADGYRWVKTDFAYWALGAERYYDRTATREEAYRRGLAAIRAGLDAGAIEAGGEPGDTFWLTVAMTGPHTGFVDAMRPNLDTMPAWQTENPEKGRKDEQGFKPTVRTIARRYFLQNRVWIFNHDMLFFRAHADPNVPPITRDEARCLLSIVALSGSVAKLGEKIVEMEPEWIADYRTILPVYGHGARPLDLFTREYPEIWHLEVEPAAGLNTGGAGPTYDLVALVNWGTNDDLTTNPYTPMADEERVLSLDLATIGLSPSTSYVAREFWTGEVLDDIQGTLTHSMAPHTVAVFALRERLDRPQYLGGNRHLFQGAVEVRGITWNDATQTLALGYDAAPGSVAVPFTHRLVFRLPPGWSLASAAVPGATGVATEVTADLLELSFAVATRQDVQISLVFND